MTTRLLERDMDRIIKSIKEMRRQADYAIVSIHSHESVPEGRQRSGRILREFCHRCNR
jgi:poly-gamma-glutamate synthesis protein (capsule biosynthesis protein)